MNDTICSIATLVGESSINIIRVSGDKSIEIVNKIFSKNLNLKATNTITYGFIIDKHEKIDEVLVSVFRAPKTFTTEDVVEINTHGGKASVARILELLLNNGARQSEPGEFLKRAFLNGRIDLIEAESVSDMISSKTESARKMSMKGITQELSIKIKDLRTSLLSLIANVEVNIDYPEYEDAVVVTKELILEKLKDINNEIKKLVDSSSSGKIIKNGLNVTIVGKPNVGKSSILNKIINEEKAIVTDIKGTTRDVVEGSILLNGIEVFFYDTAGIRETNEKIEAIGIEKSISKIKEADLIIFVVDGERFEKEDLDVLKRIKDKEVLVVYNKIDINKNKFDELNKYEYVEVSSFDKKSIEMLKEKISQIFDLKKIENSDFTYVSNSRQISLLKKSLNIIKDIEKAVKNDIPVDLLEIDIKNLWETLGEITGEVYKDELLDEIFSNFCLGK